VKEQLEKAADVLKFLESEWIISRSTLNRHIKTGRLRPTKSGKFLLRKVENYASTYLVKRSELSESEAQIARKIRLQGDILEQRAAREKAKRVAEEEGWVSKADMDQAFCQRLLLIGVMLENMAVLNMDRWRSAVTHETAIEIFVDHMKDLFDRLSRVGSFGFVEEDDGSLLLKVSGGESLEGLLDPKLKVQ
jgi:hypothetical protein